MPSLAEMQKQVTQRMAELKPLVAEHDDIEAILGRMEAALAGHRSQAEPEPARPSRRSSSPGQKRLPAAERRREVLRIVGERPMIDSPGLAEALGLSRPRVVQLTAELQREGALTRSGAGFLLAESAPVEAPTDETEAGPGVGAESAAFDELETRQAAEAVPETEPPRTAAFAAPRPTSALGVPDEPSVFTDEPAPDEVAEVDEAPDAEQLGLDESAQAVVEEPIDEPRGPEPY